MTHWNEAAVERCECGYVATDADDTEWHYDTGVHDERRLAASAGVLDSAHDPLFAESSSSDGGDR